MKFTNVFNILSRRGLLGVGAVALLAASPAIAADKSFTGEQLLPPNANAGECYTRVHVGPQFETKEEKVVVREAAEKVEMTPAKFEWVEEEVVVNEPSFKFEVIPAKYETKTEKVLAKPASTKLVEVPAKYETVTEKILDKPAQTVWKKGRGPLEKVDNSTGEIMCLVEEAAKYKTIEKRILKSPATVRTVEVPAEYKTVSKRVMVTPPETRKIEIPGKTKMVKVQKLVQPAQEKRIPIPAKYQTVSKRVKVSEGQIAWKQVLCETNLKPEVIKPLQQALAAKGLYSGTVDGKVGSRTIDALKAYQRKAGLAEGGITIETLKALNIRA